MYQSYAWSQSTRALGRVDLRSVYRLALLAAPRTRTHTPGSPCGVDGFTNRVGCLVYQPEYGLDLGRLCLAKIGTG